ncbi:hypothetical protein CPT32_28490 [Rhizobium sophoriradicis]|nr:hypothetical protein CPT32_28490 [Rhizobium sophoriradicis]PDS72112.1 hypothetical protein CO667_33735 [Rhizobium sp. L43]
MPVGPPEGRPSTPSTAASATEGVPPLRWISEAVKERRTNRGFFIIGCRFNDQMLRTYARQITKRSNAPRLAVLDAAALTNNERRFFVPIRRRPSAAIC